jgi:hypothetical protein
LEAIPNFCGSCLGGSAAGIPAESSVTWNFIAFFWAKEKENASETIKRQALFIRTPMVEGKVKIWLIANGEWLVDKHSGKLYS